jgi:ribosomal protein L3
MVAEIKLAEKILLVRGAVPGNRSGVIEIKK